MNIKAKSYFEVLRKFLVGLTLSFLNKSTLCKSIERSLFAHTLVIICT